MTIHPDTAAQISAWLDKHQIAFTDCSPADAERVAAEYHAAIAAEHLEALEMDWVRDHPTARQRRIARLEAMRAAAAPAAAEVVRRAADAPIVVAGMQEA